MWARPYDVLEDVDSIHTGLGKQFEYSPSFRNNITSVFVYLTGKRKDDYRLAETKAGIVHSPGETVWHHVWRTNVKGEYEMQLVDYQLHQKTCPHAGGVKLWSMRQGNIKRYTNRNSNIIISDRNYGKKLYNKTINRTGYIRAMTRLKETDDYVIDYIFDNDAHPSVKNCKALAHKKKAGFKLWGIDPYGNWFLKNRKGKIYFLNHETLEIESLDLRIGDLT